MELYSTEEYQKPKRIVLPGSNECAIWCKLAVLVSEMGAEYISETWAEKDVRRFTKQTNGLTCRLLIPLFFPTK